MKNIVYITTLILSLVWLSSCEPRIDMDFSQWGDHAYIDKVNMFDYSEADHELQEYYTDEIVTHGIKRHMISTSTVIDSTAATAVVTVPSAINLGEVGIFFNHRAMKVEPLDGAPKAGFVVDFSHGPYKYKLISADGTERIWTVSFTN